MAVRDSVWLEMYLQEANRKWNMIDRLLLEYFTAGLLVACGSKILLYELRSMLLNQLQVDAPGFTAGNKLRYDGTSMSEHRYVDNLDSKFFRV